MKHTDRGEDRYPK